MNITTLKERIKKAEEKIEKKQATIIKKQAWIAKKSDEFEIRWLRDDIRRLESEVEETKKTLEKYKKQLAGEMETESLFLNEIPDSMKEMQNELVSTWDAWDIARRDRIKADKKTMEYEAFCRKYNHTERWDLIYKTDDDIHNANVRDAKTYILDLYNRVKVITGEVVDWSGIRCAGPALNGLVIGKEGRAEVETILAGGYNIQRLHCRTLVHDR